MYISLHVRYLSFSRNNQQDATLRMRHIVICELPRLTVIFSTLSHKRDDFRKKLLNTKCVFWFSLQLLSEIFLILRRSERDMIKNVY